MTEEEARSKLTHIGHRAATICAQGGLDKGKHLGMDMVVVRVDQNEAKCMNEFRRAVSHDHECVLVETYFFRRRRGQARGRRR